MDYNFIGKSKKDSLAGSAKRKAQREDARRREYIQRKERRANGGCLGYPEAMKDVVSCEKVRGFANRI